ncbi:MDH2 [Symbiodinium sp. CCMP2456]|nr:MDH2 [Symbiodinium sp. CCMP2456]
MGQATFCCELTFGKTDATPLRAAGLSWSDLDAVEPAELAELLREMDLGLTEREQLLQGLRARFKSLPKSSAVLSPSESKLHKPIRQPSASTQGAVKSTCMDTNGSRGQPESTAAVDEGADHKQWQTMPAKLVQFGEDAITEEVSTGASSARECREVSGAASTPAAKFSTEPLAGNPNQKTLKQTHQGMKFRPWKPPSIVLPDDLCGGMLSLGGGRCPNIRNPLGVAQQQPLEEKKEKKSKKEKPEDKEDEGRMKVKWRQWLFCKGGQSKTSFSAEFDVPRSRKDRVPKLLMGRYFLSTSTAFHVSFPHLADSQRPAVNSMADRAQALGAATLSEFRENLCDRQSRQSMPVGQEQLEQEKARLEELHQKNIAALQAEHKAKLAKHRRELQAEFELERDRTFSELQEKHEKQVREERVPWLHELASKKGKMKQEIEALAKSEEELQKKLSESQAEATRLRSEAASLGRKCSAYDERVRRLEEDMKECRKEASHVRTSASTDAKEVASLKAQLDSKNVEIEQIKAGATSASERLAKWEEEMQRLQDLAQDNDEAKARIEQLMQDLEVKDTQRAALEQQIKDLSQSQDTEELSKQKAKVASLEASLMSEVEAKSKLQAKFSEVQSDLAKASGNRAQLDELRRELDARTAELAEARKAPVTDSELKQAKDALEEEKRISSQASADVLRFKEDLASLKAELAEERGLNGTSKAEAASASGEAARLQAELAAQSKELQRLQASSAELRSCWISKVSRAKRYRRVATRSLLPLSRCASTLTPPLREGAFYHKAWAAAGLLGASAFFVANQDRQPQTSHCFFGGAAKGNFKVCVCGGSGGIGQPLSLLMALDDNVGELSVYDLDFAMVPPGGVAADLNHLEKKVKVKGYVKSKEEKAIDVLGDCLKDCNLVLVPAGLPRKPGQTRDDLFKINAGIAKEVVEACAKYCPNAVIALIVNPVNSVVPAMAELYKKKGLDPKKIVGVTTLDGVRANKFVAEITGENPNNIEVPVIGGHAGVTIMPVFSQDKHAAKIAQSEIPALDKHVQDAGTDVVNAKNGKGSATLSMAYAGARLGKAVLAGLAGTPTTECAYVMSDVEPDCPYFTSKVTFGKSGVEKVHPIGKLNKYEEQRLAEAKAALKKEQARLMRRANDEKELRTQAQAELASAQQELAISKGTLSAREGECKRLQDKIGDAVGQHEELRRLQTSLEQATSRATNLRSELDARTADCVQLRTEVQQQERQAALRSMEEVVLQDETCLQLPRELAHASRMLSSVDGLFTESHDGRDEDDADPLYLPSSAGLTAAGIGRLCHFVLLKELPEQWPSQEASEFVRAACFLDVPPAIEAATLALARELLECNRPSDVYKLARVPESSGPAFTDEERQDVQALAVLGPTLGLIGEVFVQLTWASRGLLQNLSTDFLRGVVLAAEGHAIQSPEMQDLERSRRPGRGSTKRKRTALRAVAKERYRGSLTIALEVLAYLGDDEPDVRTVSLQVLSQVVPREHEMLAFDVDPFVEAAIGALADSSSLVRQSAAETLAYWSPLARGFVQRLEGMVLKHSGRVKATALRALATAQVVATAKTVQLALSCLEDTDTHVQLAAADALGSFILSNKEESWSIFGRIRQKLRARRASVKCAAAGALRRAMPVLGAEYPEYSETIADLIGALLSDPSSEVRCASVGTLMAVDGDMAINEAFIQALQDPHDTVCKAACDGLVASADPTQWLSLAVMLAPLLCSPVARNRCVALEALHELLNKYALQLGDGGYVTRESDCDAYDSPVMASLVPRLLDTDGYVRIAAVKTFGCLARLYGPRKDYADQLACVAATDDDDDVKSMALQALSVAAPRGDPDAAATAADASRSPSPQLRRSALLVLRHMMSFNKDVLAAVCERISDVDDGVRRLAMDCLPDILQGEDSAGVMAARTLGLVARSQSSSDQTVVCALEALARIAQAGGPNTRASVMSPVLACLKDDNWIVREAAENAACAMNMTASLKAELGTWRAECDRWQSEATQSDVPKMKALLEEEKASLSSMKAEAAETMAQCKAQAAAAAAELEARSKECGRLRAELRACRPSGALPQDEVRELVSLRARVLDLEAEVEAMHQAACKLSGPQWLSASDSEAQKPAADLEESKTLRSMVKDRDDTATLVRAFALILACRMFDFGDLSDAESVDDCETGACPEEVQQQRQPDPNGTFAQGDVVKARFQQGCWYLAAVIGQNHDGSYTIAWKDGDDSDRVKNSGEMVYIRPGDTKSARWIQHYPQHRPNSRQAAQAPQARANPRSHTTEDAGYTSRRHESDQAETEEPGDAEKRKWRDWEAQQQRFRDELLKREDQEDDRWLANRMAKLQQELREIDQLAPSARKGRLRKLQLELHPDKQPERLRAKCQKLFLIVQGRWEAHEATLQRETNQRNQDEECARAVREERQRRQRSQEERQRKHREEQEKAERERAEREARKRQEKEEEDKRRRNAESRARQAEDELRRFKENAAKQRSKQRTSDTSDCPEQPAGPTDRAKAQAKQDSERDDHYTKAGLYRQRCEEATHDDAPFISPSEQSQQSHAKTASPGRSRKQGTPKPSELHIRVRLNGSVQQEKFCVPASATVGDIKKRLDERGVVTSAQKIFCGDRELFDFETLSTLLSTGNSLDLDVVQRFPKGLGFAEQVRKNWRMLQHAPSELRSDRQLVSEAVGQSWEALKFASDSLRGDKNLVLSAVEQDGLAVEYAAPCMQKDRDVMLAAVKKTWKALRYAQPSCIDYDIAVAAVQQNWRALQHLGAQLRDKRELMEMAVQQSGLALKYASSRLQRDNELVLQAVRQNGAAFEFAAPELRCDRQFVLAAVWRNGDAFRFADPDLRADKEIALAVVDKGREMVCSQLVDENDMAHASARHCKEVEAESSWWLLARTPAICRVKELQAKVNEARLEERQLRHDDTGFVVSDLKAQLRARASEVEQLHSEVRASMSELERTRAEARHAEARAAAREISSVEAAKVMVTDDWKREVDRLQVELQKSAADIAAAKEKAERANREVRRLQQEESRVAKSQEALRGELEQAQDNNRVIREEMADAEHRCEDARSMVRAERTSRTHAETQVREYQREARALKAQLQERAAEAEKFRSEARNKSYQLEDKELEVSHLQDQIQFLEDQLRARRRDLAEKEDWETQTIQKDGPLDITGLKTAVELSQLSQAQGMGDLEVEEQDATLSPCDAGVPTDGSAPPNSPMQEREDMSPPAAWQDRAEEEGSTMHRFSPRAGAEAAAGCVPDQAAAYLQAKRRELQTEHVTVERLRHQWKQDADRLRSVSGMAREQVLLQEACAALDDRAAALQRAMAEHNALEQALHAGTPEGDYMAFPRTSPPVLGITGNPTNVLKARSDSGDTPRSSTGGHRQDRDRYPTTAAEDLSMLRRWQHLLGQDVLGTGYRRLPLTARSTSRGAVSARSTSPLRKFDSRRSRVSREVVDRNLNQLCNFLDVARARPLSARAGRARYC